MFGRLDTQFIDIPANIDQTYLANQSTRSGLAFAEMLRRADAALGQVNNGLDPLLALLLAPRTTETSVISSRGDRMTPIERSEYDPARPQMVTQRGHMLALKGYDLAIGFTEDGLEAISLDAFEDQLRGMVDGWNALFRRQVLLRLFDPAEIPVDRKQTATSPAFAGSGTGSWAGVRERPSHPSRDGCKSKTPGRRPRAFRTALCEPLRCG